MSEPSRWSDLMTMLAVQPALSDADRARLADEAGVEHIDGQYVDKPVSIESSEIEQTVGSYLRNEAAKTGEARVYGQSLGYRCFPDDPARFRKPDVSLVRAERLAGTHPSDGFMTIPPDLAVEVISPNDTAYDVSTRVEDYLSNGFRLIWVIYPATRTVAVYRGDGSTALLHARDEIAGEAALPGFRCRVADFFPAPHPAPAA